MTTATELATGRKVTMVQALLEAHQELMREDENIFVAGEDVAVFGTAWGTTRGLLEEFGPRRVLDTPISEEAIIGLAVGAAATGLRPIVELMFIDFVGECMDEVANQLAKMRYMFGGKLQLPVTVRSTSGAGLGAGAQHSQSLEAWLCHIPGLKVVMPSNPYDAKGLFVSAVRDNDPVFFIETKTLYGTIGEVPEGLYEIPLGVASTPREGSDITLIAWGAMVDLALVAADSLAADGIEVEVVDPRCLLPLDTESIVKSVRKTHNALIVHEAVRHAGFGAEIAAQIQELAFDSLDGPVARLGAPFSPVPFAPALEQLYVPDAARIERAVHTVLGG